MEQNCSVVVVGAGISGLRAAQLLKNQFPDVLVVEADNKVGGRVQAVSCVLKCMFEASWAGIIAL